MKENLGIVPRGEETLVKREDCVPYGKMKICKISGNEKSFKILYERRTKRMKSRRRREAQSCQLLTDPEGYFRGGCNQLLMNFSGNRNSVLSDEPEDPFRFFRESELHGS
jgi:hypothetical protein